MATKSGFQRAKTLWSGQGLTALAECEAEPHGNPFCLRKRTGRVNFVQPKGCAKEGNRFKRAVLLKRFADNRKSTGSPRWRISF